MGGSNAPSVEIFFVQCQSQEHMLSECIQLLNISNAVFARPQSNIGKLFQITLIRCTILLVAETMWKCTVEKYELKILKAIEKADCILLRACITIEDVSQLGCLIGSLLMCFGPSFFVEKMMPCTYASNSAT